MATYLFIIFDFYRNAELEAALLEECDFGSLRNICKGRPVPERLRPEVWQVILVKSLFRILIV